jgi:hypothetical protein
MDFKGYFISGDGKRCDPFTITDAHNLSKILSSPDGPCPWLLCLISDIASHT